MKQQITIDQFYELSEDGIKRYDEWCAKKKYWHLSGQNGFSSNLLTIGQMIEFISTHTSELDVFIRGFSNRIWEVEIDHGALPFNYAEKNSGEYVELCDSLWFMTKEILNDNLTVT